MLVAIEGKVVHVRQLTDTGFSEVTLEDTQSRVYKAAGSDLMIMRKNEQVVVIGREEVKKFGPQTRVLRWWTKELCPFTNLQDARKAIAFLYDELKLPPATAQRIFDAYLDQAEAVIRDNPYRIATEGLARRISVTTIDKYIAPHFQISSTDKRRLKAQILSTLRMARSLYGIPVYTEESTGEQFGRPGGGHVYSDFTQVVGVCAEEMEIDRRTISGEVRRMASEPRNPLNKKPLIVIDKDTQGQDRYVYPYSLYTAEKGLAHHVRRILRSPVEDFSGLEIVCNDLVLSDEQRAAVKMSLTSALSIITGGPGVGKTTIIKALTSTLEKNSIRFALCAPTGVAARRMVKATGQPAATIHRTLQVDPIQGCFRHDRGNPLAEQVIICDESSMIDIGLMYSLFDAVASGARIVLVGDADQLPPVGPGSPFRDLVAWGKIPTTRLTEVRRQELSDSLIIQGSRSILAKKMPTFSKEPPVGDLYAFSYANEMQALKLVGDLVLERITQTFGIPRDGIQVLCPHRRAKRRKKKDSNDESSKLLASENVNAVLQEKIHGKRADSDVRFHVGDRVIQTKNDYNIDVMNGEIGYVRAVNIKEHKTVRRVGYTVEYEDGKKVAYDDRESLQLDLAYALSVHKSQGTESPAVVVLAYHCGNFFSRNMLYTAVTRGKRLVCIVSPKGGTSFAKILQVDETSRASRLIWRIENEQSTSDEIGSLTLDELSESEGE